MKPTSRICAPLLLGALLLAPGVLAEEDDDFASMPDIGSQAKGVMQNVLKHYQETGLPKLKELWDESDAAVDVEQAMLDHCGQVVARGEFLVGKAREHWAAYAKKRGIETSEGDLPEPWVKWADAYKMFFLNLTGAYLPAVQHKVNMVQETEMLDAFKENDWARYEDYVNSLVVLNRELEAILRTCMRIEDGDSRGDADRKSLLEARVRLLIWQATLMNWAVVIDDMQKRGTEIFEDDDLTADAMKAEMEKHMGDLESSVSDRASVLDQEMLFAVNDWQVACKEHVQNYKDVRNGYEAVAEQWMGGDEDLFPAENLKGRTGWEVLRSFQQHLYRVEAILD